MKTKDKKAFTVAGIKSLPHGKYHIKRGMIFSKNAGDGGSWIYRYSRKGVYHDMGLGSFPDVTFAQAKGLRDKWASVRGEGKDPIEERERELENARRGENPFAEIAVRAFEARKPGLRGDGNAGRWFSPLKIHVIPSIGQISIDEVTQQDILRALGAIWNAKPETAKKALNRIGIVMAYGAAMELHPKMDAVKLAKALLGDQFHVAVNIPSMPWQDVPAFYAKIRALKPEYLALRLLILTGARSKAIRCLTRDQISDGVWTVPAETMKGRKGKTLPFRHPLPKEALTVIAAAKRIAKGDLIFADRRGKALPERAMSDLMRDMGEDARPHGFRSSLRMWLNDEGVEHTLAETMLAHSVGSAASRAYLRTDHLEARAPLAAKWAKHVLGG